MIAQPDIEVERPSQRVPCPLASGNLHRQRRPDASNPGEDIGHLRVVQIVPGRPFGALEEPSGTKLVAKYKGKEHTAIVVAPEDKDAEGRKGSLRYRLEDGREFTSPSSAGRAVTGGAVNGWRFWSVAEQGQPEPTAPEPAAEPGQEPEADAPAGRKPATAGKRQRRSRSKAGSGKKADTPAG
ncbi:MAG: hypothetical protein V3S18_03455 [Dehalococcoidia bacterium]